MKKVFEDQVAIVTGAGNGLGRSHALALAERGAKVLVNDLGGDKTGQGKSSEASESVVKEIEALGGEAMANGANVADYEQVESMVGEAMDRWGRVDILINNAGILRDKSFAKMSLDDFKLVVDVHLMGSVHCTKAVWTHMQQQNYGRIVMTTSSSGLYGNFGQSNYGAAKLALVGLMNTLALEGAKHNIRVNSLAPAAGTRMLEGLAPQEILDKLTTESVSVGLLSLCDPEAPTKTILCAGAGCFAAAKIFETDGVYLPEPSQSLEEVKANWGSITSTEGQAEFSNGSKQTEKFMGKVVEFERSQ